MTEPVCIDTILRRDLSQRMDELAQDAVSFSRQLHKWLSHHTLRKSVLIIDDSSPALCVLVSLLAPTGVAIHAVSTDGDPHLRRTVESFGGELHLVRSYEDASLVWAETRSAVVVVDLHLGVGLSGLDVIDSIGRGPGCIVVTSCDAPRDSVERAATSVQAESMVRTDSGAWETSLRDSVLRLLNAMPRHT